MSLSLTSLLSVTTAYSQAPITGTRALPRVGPPARRSRDALTPALALPSAGSAGQHLSTSAPLSSPCIWERSPPPMNTHQGGRPRERISGCRPVVLTQGQLCLRGRWVLPGDTRAVTAGGRWHPAGRSQAHRPPPTLQCIGRLPRPRLIQPPKPRVKPDNPCHKANALLAKFKINRYSLGSPTSVLPALALILICIQLKFIY